MTTILLHGFWGQPLDWKPVIERLPLSLSVQAPDLYLPGSLAPTANLETWCEEFWRWVDATVGAEQRVQIVGYSMGGRLGLSAAMRAPKRVHRALFLSANPLLPDLLERETWEKTWADRFRTEAWPALEREWQEQGVFAQTKVLPRRRSEVLRELLPLSLLNWSPRHHRFAVGDLAALPPQVEWAFGALDQKYMDVAKILQELPVQGQINVVSEAGHRLLIEAACFVSQWITGV